MEGGRVPLSYGHGHYGVVRQRAPDIVAICVLQIRLPYTQLADGILADSQLMLPTSKSRMMTTAEANQVGAFRLGKGRSALLVRGRCMHLL